MDIIVISHIYYRTHGTLGEFQIKPLLNTTAQCRWRVGGALQCTWRSAWCRIMESVLEALGPVGAELGERAACCCSLCSIS